ncbi:MAG: hypothetical protein ACYC1U_04145 [Candidatus Aquicultorales bacterium]
MQFFKPIPELVSLKAVQEEADTPALERKRNEEEIAKLAKERMKLLRRMVDEFVGKISAVRPELFFEQKVAVNGSYGKPSGMKKTPMVRLVSMSSNGPLRGFFADKEGNLFRSGFEPADPKPVYVVRPVAYEDWAFIWFDLDMIGLGQEMQEILETGEY